MAVTRILSLSKYQLLLNLLVKACGRSHGCSLAPALIEVLTPRAFRAAYDFVS